MSKESKYYEKTYLNENAIGAFDERFDKVVSNWGGIAMNSNGNATVAIYGGLYPMDYDYLTAQLEFLKNNEDVKSVTLHINSPGGAVAGLFDCCDYIKSFGKPINAYISGMACSAAYAIATSCERVYAQQDSETGCCGCYAHPIEPNYEKMGFLHRVFRSKNAPRKNVSCITNEDEAKAFQESVDELGDKYLAYVASNRGIDVETAEKTFGQGASVSATYALENGMIDGICSIEEFTDIATDSSLDEGEGEDMDIRSMSAEEQQKLFCELCEANPSLLEERVEASKRAETERITNLNALRNGSAAVDALVDAAIADGRDMNAIALDVIKTMNAEAPKVKEEARKSALEAMAEGGQEVVVPKEAISDEELINAMFEHSEKEN